MSNYCSMCGFKKTGTPFCPNCGVKNCEPIPKIAPTAVAVAVVSAPAVATATVVGKQNCKAVGCFENHRTHKCRACDDKDSDHRASKCTKGWGQVCVLTQTKPLCEHGLNCYRTNNQAHMKEFEHVAVLTKPFCKYGNICYRTHNQAHMKEFNH